MQPRRHFSNLKPEIWESLNISNADILATIILVICPNIVHFARCCSRSVVPDWISVSRDRRTNLYFRICLFDAGCSSWFLWWHHFAFCLPTIVALKTDTPIRDTTHYQSLRALGSSWSRERIQLYPFYFVSGYTSRRRQVCWFYTGYGYILCFNVLGLLSLRKQKLRHRLFSGCGNLVNWATVYKYARQIEWSPELTRPSPYWSANCSISLITMCNLGHCDVNRMTGTGTLR